MTEPVLSISHYVFLTREQRYALIVPESEIEVVGHYCSSWIGVNSTDFVEEVFAKYSIRHCLTQEDQTVGFIEQGFEVKLSPEMPKLLLDYEDRGNEGLNITFKSKISSKGNVFSVIHFLNMEDMNVLEGTLC